MKKKKFLLTMAATTAMVITTAASYATWDVTEDTKAVSITTGKGVRVSASELNFTGTLADSVLGSKEITADLTVTIDGDTTGKKLTFDATEMKLAGVAEADVVVVSVSKAGIDLPTNVDENITASNTYKVKVALPANATAEKYAEKQIDFNLNTELVAK